MVREGAPGSAEGVALIRRVAEGDRQAFADLYDRYAPLAFGLIRRVVARAAAEEVLQELFWQVWLDADAYDPDRGSPEGWLLDRARSQAIARLRASRRRGETLAAPPDDAIARAPDAARRDPTPVAETVLGILPARERQVIQLAFYEGLTQSEIAERLGEPLGTVKTRTRTGLTRLRDHFLGTPGTPR